MTVTCVDRQKCCYFHRMVQCYGLMLHIATKLLNNFLQLVNLLLTALVTQCSLWRGYIMALHYMSIPSLTFISKIPSQIWNLYQHFYQFPTNLSIFFAGFWLLHCHFTYHSNNGMVVILQVGERNQMGPVPRDFPKCNNYVPPVTYI